MVFDWLHHRLNPGRNLPVTTLIERCFATWGADDGPPKTHYSSQASGGRAGAHAEWIAIDDFLAFIDATPDQPFDCMLEAKAKDLALLRLRRELTARGRPLA